MGASESLGAEGPTPAHGGALPRDPQTGAEDLTPPILTRTPGENPHRRRHKGPHTAGEPSPTEKLRGTKPRGPHVGVYQHTGANFRTGVPPTRGDHLCDAPRIPTHPGAADSAAPYVSGQAPPPWKRRAGTQPPRRNPANLDPVCRLKPRSTSAPTASATAHARRQSTTPSTTHPPPLADHPPPAPAPIHTRPPQADHPLSPAPRHAPPASIVRFRIGRCHSRKDLDCLFASPVYRLGLLQADSLVLRGRTLHRLSSLASWPACQGSFFLARTF